MWEFLICSKKILLNGSKILLEDYTLLINIVELVLGGLCAFFAILLSAKTRNISLVSLIIAILSMYAGIVYKTLIKMGVVVNQGFLVFGIPIFTLIVTIFPYIFLIVALVTLFNKLNK